MLPMAMAYTVMAYVAAAYTFMAHIVTARIVMACVLAHRLGSAQPKGNAASARPIHASGRAARWHILLPT